MMLFTFSPSFLFAQPIVSSDSDSSGMRKVLSYYTASLGINAAIYTGSENADPRYPINDGFPFYGSDNAVKGEVFYEGVLFKDVPMWYDIVTNEVAVQHPKMNARIALNSNKVQYFVLGNFLFIPRPAEIRKPLSTDDFCRVLYDKKTALLAGYRKKMFEVIQESQYVTNYSRLESEYFLLKDGVYHQYRNISGLINLLDDKKHELQQQLKKLRDGMKRDGGRLNTNSELAMISLVEYYDEISP